MLGGAVEGGALGAQIGKTPEYGLGPAHLVGPPGGPRTNGGGIVGIRQGGDRRGDAEARGQIVGRGKAPAAVLLPCLLVVGLTACSDKNSANTNATKTVATVNSVCPMMSNPFDGAKVPVSLTRDFKGQKVGFCCCD